MTSLTPEQREIERLTAHCTSMAKTIAAMREALEGAGQALTAAEYYFDAISTNCQGASICDGDENGAHETNFNNAMEGKQAVTDAFHGLNAILNDGAQHD